MEGSSESKSKMRKRHQKELKELKKDLDAKKKKKQITAAELAERMEALSVKHDTELKAAGGDSDDEEGATTSQVGEQQQSTPDAAVPEPEPTSTSEGPQKKMSRQAKRKAKKAEAEAQREREIAEEKANTVSARDVEDQAIEARLQCRSMKIYQIPSDGHCMYRALSHQIKLHYPDVHGTMLGDNDFMMLRKEIAKELRKNPNDYMPFVNLEAHGNSFEQYCDEVENTSMWGGHIELQAASKLLNLPIEVVSASGDAVKVGESEAQPLTVTYHLHAYGLGEHYNSVQSI